jgi:hypothetical protein
MKLKPTICSDVRGSTKTCRQRGHGNNLISFPSENAVDSTFAKPRTRRVREGKGAAGTHDDDLHSSAFRTVQNGRAAESMDRLVAFRALALCQHCSVMSRQAR